MKAQLRAINPEIPHARDIAAQRVKRWRSNAERDKLPISNQSTGAANLFVNEVLQRTLREIPELEIEKSRSWLVWLLGLGGLISLLWILVS